jgi:hypothetical protein
MTRAISDYFARLVDAFGRGWTRFWFTPSDPSMLCAMRLLVGVVVVYLHATLSWDLIAFFGPEGLLPAAEIAPLEADTISYLNYLSEPAQLWAVHLVGLAILLLFTAGFWTRLTSVLALVVFLSDVNRAPMIAGRTESVTAMLMCYLCLAPCGQRFSIDELIARRTGRTRGGSSTMSTIATRLIQIHLALLVAMMGLSQLSSEVWWMGTAMWWLASRGESRLVDLTWMASYPKLINVWTHAVIFFELSFPVLIWVPLARPLLLAAGVLVWASLALVTGDITFALVMGIASLAFVSPPLVSACCDRGSQPAATSLP